MSTPCTQQYRPAAKSGAGRRFLHHGNGTTDPHLYGAYFPGQQLLEESGPAGAEIVVTGFGDSPVASRLAIAGVLPVPRGTPDHRIVLPRVVTLADGYCWREPDYGDGTYAARLESLPILLGGVWTHDHRLMLQITMTCRMADGKDMPILYFLGNTDKLAQFLAGEEIVVVNRLTSESAITSLFQSTAGRAIIRASEQGE